MDEHTFNWSFGTASFIDVYKDNITYAHFSYDDKLKIHVVWSTQYLSGNDWEQVLTCVREAKVILKKLRRI